MCSILCCFRYSQHRMGAGKGPEPQALGGTAIKPVGWDRTGWEAFRYMIYNPDTGEVLTRTPLSWAKVACTRFQR